MSRAENCLKSATSVAEAIQKDDGVIILWSFDSFNNKFFFDLLTANKNGTSWLKFDAHRIKHPKSGDQILLVGVPNPYDAKLGAAAREGLNHILTHAETIGVKYITHIWIHPLGSPGYLNLSRMPYNCIILKEIFGGSVEMDQVTFLTTNWEKIDPPVGNSKDEKIQRALADDINDGMVLESLLDSNACEAWKVIDRVIEDAREWPKEKTQYRMVEWGRMRVVRRIARLIQKELDLLREELNETKAGQKVIKALRECYAEEKETLTPLRDKMRRDDITAAAKEAVEKELLEMHSIFKKRFQACFYRAVDLRAPIGQAIIDQYFDDLPEEVKKSKWPFGLFGHRSQRSADT